MRKTLWAAVVMATLAGPALAAQTQQTQQGQQGQQQMSQQDRQSIMQLEKDRQNAMNSKDANAVSRLYTANGTSRDAQGREAKGQSQIQQQTSQNAQAMRDAAVEINVVSVEPIDKNTALIDAQRKITSPTNPSLNVTAHEVAVAKKEGNQWKLVATREFVEAPAAAVGGAGQQPGMGGAGQQQQPDMGGAGQQPNP